MASSTWALSQISKILPLDNESLQEILDYSSTLSKEVAAEHLKNLLGDSQHALDFINAFNSHREPQATTSSPSPHPVESKGKPRKKKASFNKLPPPRQPENYGNVAGRYVKKEDDDYIAALRRPRQEGPAASSSLYSRRINEPAAGELTTATITNKPPKAPPSASGPLISDLPNARTSNRAAPITAKTKVNISGGSAMHGASAILQDLVSLSLSMYLSSLRLTSSLFRTLPFVPWKFKPIHPSPPPLQFPPAGVTARQLAILFSLLLQIV